MKVLILTTNTPHHTYFVNKFRSKHKNTFVLCYSNKVIKMLKKFKFKCSPTAIYGSNGQKENLFNLKRIIVA
jgi:hypothetical protein